MRVSSIDSQAKNNKNKSVSFSGYNKVKDDQGNTYLRFLLPYDTKQYYAKVQLVDVKKDENGNFVPQYPNGKKSNFDEIKLPENQNYIDLNINDIKKKHNGYLGYRFYLIPKNNQDTSKLRPYLDPGLRTKVAPSYNKGDYSVIDLDRPVLSTSRQMTLVLPDSFAPEYTVDAQNKEVLLKEHFDKIQNNVQRHYFNKYDGTLNGVISKLDYIKDSGAKRVISTPIFGQDNISAFGYWTTNPYQITSSLGDMNDFRNLQTEVYKRGMGWIADGAFVNEGLEGIHVRDVLKNGEKSPYFNWFKTYLFPMNTLQLGVLPTHEEKMKNVGINFVNAPVIYSLKTENGKTRAVAQKNPDYDKKQPTFIQIYPKDKVSESLLNKNQKIATADIKKTTPYETKSVADSVSLYSFEVSPEELEKNYEKLKTNLHRAHGEATQGDFVNAFSSYKNFTLVQKGRSGGAETWAGNDDILKLSFMVSSDEADKSKEKRAAVNQVQDYVLQVGEFWTKETANTIKEYTARTIAQNLDQHDGQGFKKAISQSVEKGKLDKQVDAKLNMTTINAALNGSYKMPQDPVDLKIGNDLQNNILKNSMSYPLEAIEFAPDMTAILGSPYIKKLANTQDDIMKTRYELSQGKSYKFVDESYRETYKNMDSFYKNDLGDFSKEILKLVDSKKSGEKILSDDGNNLTDFGKELYPLISNDIVKFAIIKSLKNDVGVTEDKNEQLKYNQADLQSVSAKSLGLDGLSSKDAADKTVELLKKGLKQISPEDKQKLAENIAKRFNNVDTDTLKVAKVAVDKTESGLEWRIDAAKDVGNLSDIANKNDTFENVWQNISGFWGKFATKVRAQNPNAYIIGELTDVPSFFDSSWSVDQKGRYRNAGDAESSFVIDTKFSTITNYSYFYNLFQTMYGNNFEPNNEEKSTDHLRSNMLNGYTGTPGFLYSNPVDAITYSQVFMDNQDKPRILHGYALDMNLFYSDLKNPRDEKIARKFWEPTASVANMNAKSIAVGNVMSDAIDNNSLLNDGQKALLQDALKDLVKGEYKGKKFDPTFFAIKPFDQSIDDLFEEASFKNKEFADFDKNPANETQIRKMKDKIHENIMKPAYSKDLASSLMMMCLPGSPDFYSGTELGETGFETPDHNSYLQCRNRNHWEWISQDKDLQKYNKPHVMDFNKKIKEVYNLRDRKELSPLTNGFTTVLQEQNAYEPVGENGKNEVKTVALLRYNNDTDLIQLYSKNGFGSSPKDSKLKNYKVDYIGLNPGSGEEGIPGGLKIGTKYKNALNENDHNSYFVIKYDGMYMLKKFKDDKQYAAYKDLEADKNELFKIEKDRSQAINLIKEGLNLKDFSLKDKDGKPKSNEQISNEINTILDKKNAQHKNACLKLEEIKEKLLSGENVDRSEILKELKGYGINLPKNMSDEKISALLDNTVSQSEQSWERKLVHINETKNRLVAFDERRNNVIEKIKNYNLDLGEKDGKKLVATELSNNELATKINMNISDMIDKNTIDVDSSVIMFSRAEDYKGKPFKNKTKEFNFCGKNYIEMHNTKYPIISSSKAYGRSAN